MKVLLLNGSPNAQGCTYTALQEIAKELQKAGIESEIFQIGKKPISGCIACRGCKAETAAGCVLPDGIVTEFQQKLADADGLIVGSPVYFASANGSVISLLDRAFYSNRTGVVNKPASAVVSARRGGTTATIDELNKYFLLAGMPVVSSSYWNMVHGNTPEEVLQDAEGLQTMRNLARNMAWMLKSIEAGKAAGVEAPVRE
ncbi:MAG: flavodoxin family protein, partial [Firmicutes bacterium]|nr:flavodoxin family protein [Bacillota bacterium]